MEREDSKEQMHFGKKVMAMLLNLCQRDLVQGPAGGQGAPTPKTHGADSPTDDLLGLSPDEMLLLRGQNAQGELLACPALPIHHICALVHVNGALREGCGLQEEDEARSHSEASSKGT